MRLVWLVVVAACGRSADGPAAAPAASASPARAVTVTVPQTPAEPGCEELPFAASTPVPEASGAAWLTIDGALALVVISDSGNRGAYGIVDPDSGETREQGMLPLGGGGDDLEGVAMRDGRLIAISSAGWIREWRRVAGGFELVAGPYPLGPVDLPAKSGGIGARPPEGEGMVCAERASNCGRNYEGLCLAHRPRSDTRCVGFAAAKADGHLYCVVEREGRLALDRSHAIAIARPGVIADCAFDEADTLYVGSNTFDLARVYRVHDWHDPARARSVVIGELPIGFPETLAVRGDVFYRMSDTGVAPSLMKKYRCR
jgi:hypothetical protein